MTNELVLFEFENKRRWTFYIPIFGIISYWRFKNKVMKDQNVVIPRKGAFFDDPEKKYVALSTPNADYWVLKEYEYMFNFYRNFMIKSLFFPWFFLLCLCMIFNLQPFLDVYLWKKAIAKFAK